MFENFDFRPGKLILNDMKDIDANFSTESQIDELKEDLVLVDFNGKFAIDIGWIPSFDKNGQFLVHIIKDCDWENPVEKKTTKDLHELTNIFKDFLGKVKVVVTRQNNPGNNPK